MQYTCVSRESHFGCRTTECDDEAYEVTIACACDVLVRKALNLTPELLFEMKCVTWRTCGTGFF